MCVAGLNVAISPCNHRWYQLKRSCSADRNLTNCPEKLKFEGMETRNENCPWCNESEHPLHASTHRLFGSTLSASSVLSSPASPEIRPTRPRRSGSGGTLSTLSRSGSFTGTEDEIIERYSSMNDRLHLYLTMHHSEVLPSAKRAIPPSSRVNSPISDVASISSSTSILGKGWRRRMKLGKGVLNR